MVRLMFKSFGFALFALVASFAYAPMVFAQAAFPTVFPQSILILDREVLFSKSNLGQAMLTVELENRQAALLESNEISLRFEQEEQLLTDIRPDTNLVEFANLATEFDQRVQEMRAEQLSKDLALQQAAENNRRRFFELTLPYLSRIMHKYQASAVLDARSVVIFSKEKDITVEAISLLDQAFAENPKMLDEEE